MAPTLEAELRAKRVLRAEDEELPRDTPSPTASPPEGQASGSGSSVPQSTLNALLRHLVPLH